MLSNTVIETKIERSEMLTLYQFPISHYCEKARWALDFKKLEYKTVNLLPGLHFAKTKKLASQSSVPVLTHDKNIIQGSSEIISYLDDTFPEQPLTPGDNELRKAAIEWEQIVDQDIGPHIRRFIYHTLLDHPDIVIPFFTTRGPWYGKLYLRLAFPQLTKRMRQMMEINEKSAQNSIEHFRKAIHQLEQHLADKTYLVGEHFTRADLAAASLLAPLVKPEKYGLIWPEILPDPLQSLFEEFEPRLKYVETWYKKYR